MGFVKNLAEIDQISRAGEAEFYDAEMVTVYWETRPEIVARILPPPLQPVERPLVSAFIANYPLTNFSLPSLSSSSRWACASPMPRRRPAGR